MSAGFLILLAGICYITAVISLLLAIIIWYKAGIPRVLAELKGKAGITPGIPDKKSREKDAVTELLSGEPEIMIIDDIVIAHGVSTLTE